MRKNATAEQKDLPAFEIIMDTNVAIRGELFPSAAPNTVGNFIDLANSGFYDGLRFHRCIRNFIIQGGNSPEELPYRIRGEFEFNGDKCNKQPHAFGSLCMSRENHYDSASSQFYIVVTDDPRELNCLNGAYAVFGRVTEGMRTVAAISQVKTDRLDAPLQEQLIRRVRVKTFGQSYPFEKLPPPASPVNAPSIRRHNPAQDESTHISTESRS